MPLIPADIRQRYKLPRTGMLHIATDYYQHRKYSATARRHFLASPLLLAGLWAITSDPPISRNALSQVGNLSSYMPPRTLATRLQNSYICNRPLVIHNTVVQPHHLSSSPSRVVRGRGVRYRPHSAHSFDHLGPYLATHSFLDYVLALFCVSSEKLSSWTLAFTPIFIQSFSSSCCPRIHDFLMISRSVLALSNLAIIYISIYGFSRSLFVRDD